jgi:lysophospholipase L1-like esterase
LSFLKSILFKKCFFIFFLGIVVVAEAEFLSRGFYPVVQIEKISAVGDPIAANGRFKLSKDPVLLYEWKEWPQRFLPKKAKNIFRIIVLGDSVTLHPDGILDDYFPKKCEEFLNQGLPKARFEVINFGIPGYNTHQEVRLLETQLLSYAPDLVILGYCSRNDRTVKRRVVRYKEGVFSSDVAESYPYVDSGGSSLIKGLMRHSYFYRMLNAAIVTYFDESYWQKFKNNALDFKMPKGFIDLRSRIFSFYQFWDKGWTERFFKTMAQDFKAQVKYFDYSFETQGAVKKLKNLSEKEGFDLLVVVFPNLATGPQVESDWIMELCRAQNIKALDLRPVFEVSGFENVRLSSRDLVHLNSLGHVLTARKIAKYLSKEFDLTQ